MEIILIVILVLILLAVVFLFQKTTSAQKSLTDSQEQFSQRFESVTGQLINGMNEQKTQIAVQNEKLETQRSDSFNAISNFNNEIVNFRKEVSETIAVNNKSIDGKLSSMSTQLMSGNQIIGDVKERFGEIMETTRQIYNIGKDISSLENLLKSPKLRGNLGEYLLEDLLKQIIPVQNFSKQYKFKNGEKVDFAIHLGDKIVPIDSKFPLENFRKFIESEDEAEKASSYKEAMKNVKKHIDDISRKYINPSEGTFDFAMMYIPAENVYYEAIIKEEATRDEKSIYMYSIEKRVVPVSPNSMFAYLQSILIGLRGLQIEKNAEEILNNIASLKGDYGKFAENFRVLGAHLNNASKQYDESSKKLNNFENRLDIVVSDKELAE